MIADQPPAMEVCQVSTRRADFEGREVVVRGYAAARSVDAAPLRGACEAGLDFILARDAAGDCEALSQATSESLGGQGAAVTLHGRIVKVEGMFGDRPGWRVIADRCEAVVAGPSPYAAP